MTKAMAILVFALVAPLAAVVVAQERDELLGTFEDWSAFHYSQGGARVCYIASTPLDMAPKNVRRGDVYMLVTHDIAAGTRDVVSLVAGYTFEDASVTVADIDGTEYRLFTDNDAAWNRTPEQDSDMVQAMIRGSRLVVRGVSNRGTPTTDVYSLLGFTAAHAAITQACG